MYIFENIDNSVDLFRYYCDVVLTNNICSTAKTVMKYMRGERVVINFIEAALVAAS